MNPNQIKTISSRIRLINFAIDLITTTILSETINMCLLKSHNEESISLLMDTTIKILVFFFYYLYMEGAFGRTLGKIVTGTILVNLDNQRPKTSIVIIRTLIRMIPVLNLFDAISFLKTDKTGLHDSLTGTKLVKSKDFPSVY